MEWVLQQLQTYPEVFSGLVGMVVAIILTEIGRLYYFPKDWDITDQWRAIIPVDIFLCAWVTHSLWHFLDHDHDSPGLRLIGSLCFGVGCIAVHLVGLAWARKKWPWIADVDPSPKP